MIKFIATENNLLLTALGLAAPESSKSTLRSWLKEGRVQVDGEVCKHPQQQLNKGQEITVGGRPRFAQGGVRLLYEDRHLVVIEKPAGLLSVATAFEKLATVHGFLKSHYYPNLVYPVHRLDQDTSGLLLFALTEKSRDALKEMFEKHTIKRVYTAIVEGLVQPSKGSWKSYQYEDSNYYVHNSIDPLQGKLAITHYEVVRTTPHYSWLELHLETGRKNQIRAHCQQTCAIVGDKKYGAVTNPLKRVGLHAHLLSFNHPLTDKKMSFDSAIPDNFYRLFHMSADQAKGKGG